MGHNDAFFERMCALDMCHTGPKPCRGAGTVASLPAGEFPRHYVAHACAALPWAAHPLARDLSTRG